MTSLEKLKTWLATYSGYDILSSFYVDYTDQIPSNGGVFPSGIVEISRRKDVLGNVSVLNQYNFGIYCVFTKAPGDDTSATTNADWISDFQEWVQEQSITGAAPKFGDSLIEEKITAQNGMLYGATDEGLGTYMVQLSVQFRKNY
jgi:hypothetical protein